ncbi:Dolichyl-diphosphooligosaccharide--protein glycosyltransferase subunit Swp1 protein [Raphanus sativus]|nr:Dolichyl-diphosphooligosaccharide--protein glycosyltransferase subunit Swp1 protein [Raphanus sativus]
MFCGYFYGFRFSVPLILSLPSTVISSTKKRASEEKLLAKQLSLVFLGLIALPFIAYTVGSVNIIKSFPSSVGDATSVLLFHGGIEAVLLLNLGEGKLSKPFLV